MKTTVQIDSYILDTLMADLVGHDRRPSAYLTFLAIWSAGDGALIALSYADLAQRTGLSKRAAQAAVAHLLRRELLEVIKAGTTDTPRYRPLTPGDAGDGGAEAQPYSHTA
jgi:hypothetical protein